MQNGHLLIAKEKDPAAFIEFGPEGDEPSGFGARLRAHGRRSLADRGGRSRLRPARGLDALGQAGEGLRGLQRPRGRTGPPPLPAQRQVPVDRPGRGTGRRRARGQGGRGLGAPALDGKPEGLALTRNGRAIVALDTKLAQREPRPPRTADRGGRDVVTARRSPRPSTPRPGASRSEPGARTRSARRPTPRARTSRLSRSTRRPSSCSSSSATTRPSRSRPILLDPSVNRTFHFWHVYVHGVTPGMRYAYRVDGPQDLHGGGHRFNPNKVLIDPYGRGTTSTLWDRGRRLRPGRQPRHLDAQRRHRHRPTTTGRATSRSTGRCSDTVIYEMHVARLHQVADLGRRAPRHVPRRRSRRSRTSRRSASPRSSCCRLRVRRERGAAAPTRSTGQQLRQLLGLQPDRLLRPARGLLRRRPTRAATSASSATWSRRCTRPASRSSSTSSSTTPAKATTRARRSASGASTTASTTTSSPTTSSTTRTTRAAATRSTATIPIVEKFIVECLHYWVREMHVDGFRFDLASILSPRRGRRADGRTRRSSGTSSSTTTLADTKIIAEAWDAGGPLPGRLLPRLPLGGVERPLPRRRPPLRQGRPRAWSATVAARIAGSADIYQADGRAADQQHQLHHRHDGFTLNDLVSYNEQAQRGQRRGQPRRQRRQPQLELRRRGRRPTTRRSRRCAAARSRTSPTILMLSRRACRCSSRATRSRRTQHGNNNAYCQDNEITWFDWTRVDEHADLLRFFQRADRLPQGATRRCAARASSPASSTSAAWPTSRWHGCRSSTARLGRPGRRASSPSPWAASTAAGQPTRTST